MFLQAVLRELVKSGKQLPVVLDADALNLFAADESLWKLTAESGAAVICTPHKMCIRDSLYPPYACAR